MWQSVNTTSPFVPTSPGATTPLSRVTHSAHQSAVHKSPGSPLSPFSPFSPGAASLPSLPSLPGWPGEPWAPGVPGIPGWPVHRLAGILLSSSWLERWTWKTRRECSRGSRRGEIIAVTQLKEGEEQKKLEEEHTAWTGYTWGDNSDQVKQSRPQEAEYKQR